ncbi:MAG: FliM/FliN family flagellar motor switch protein [Firmicutes bacterium]|nr:FliM/FliN family flagellar motor switch protein [Bacillota bacterium]
MSDVLTQDELDLLIKGRELGADCKDDHNPEYVEQKQEIISKNKQKLALILDVPVKSRVVVGKTQKRLQDLLALVPGSLIETDNSVSDMVELYVNDHLIALGEVVVIGENYGLRVKQIVTPVERIRKLS